MPWRKINSHRGFVGGRWGSEQTSAGATGSPPGIRRRKAGTDHRTVVADHGDGNTRRLPLRTAVLTRRIMRATGPRSAGGAGATGRMTPASLFQPSLLRARPYHAGLFARAEAQLPVESLLVAGAEPEQLDALQVGVVQNGLHDLGPDLLALIGRIHEHVPDRSPVYVVGQD